MILPVDISTAARALLCLPAGVRWDRARDWVGQAGAARAYLEAQGRAHPEWGSGSLMARARKERLLPEPTMDDPDYAACMILMLLAVQAQPEAQLMQRGAAGSSASRAGAIDSPQSSQ